MTHEFDKAYWESHWQKVARHEEFGPNPYLVRETSNLIPGTALDAGCGEGTEAIWLATEGWQVTAADISAEVLSLASERAAKTGAPEHVRWIEADLSAWEPEGQFDLVTTHYAHPAMPQLAFYKRISDWVKSGGTLLIVGHLHTSEHGQGQGQGHQDHGHQDPGHPPQEASATAATITAVLDIARWKIVTAEEHSRTLTTSSGQALQLNDVVVRATRLP